MMQFGSSVDETAMKWNQYCTWSLCLLWPLELHASSETWPVQYLVYSENLHHYLGQHKKMKEASITGFSNYLVSWFVKEVKDG